MYFKIAYLHIGCLGNHNADPYYIDLGIQTNLSKTTFLDTEEIEKYLREINTQEIKFFWNTDLNNLHYEINDNIVACIHNRNDCYVVRVASIKGGNLVYHYYGLYNFTDDEDSFDTTY